MNLRQFLAGSAIVLAFAAPAGAQEPAAPAGGQASLLKALTDCAALTEPQARLACYDGLAPRLKAALAKPPAVVARRRPPTKEEQKSWFGFNMDDLFGSGQAQQTTPQTFGAENTPAAQTAREDHKSQAIDSITAGLTEYAYNPFGKFLVILDNGQIWKQLQGDSGRAHFRRKASDNKVTISRGFLGSYNLTINGSNKVYKVNRVK